MKYNLHLQHLLTDSSPVHIPTPLPSPNRIHTIFRLTNTLPWAFSTALSCLPKCSEVPDVALQMSHILSLVLFWPSLSFLYLPSPLSSRTSALLLCKMSKLSFRGRVSLEVRRQEFVVTGTYCWWFHMIWLIRIPYACSMELLMCLLREIQFCR